ncbi:MAG: hypothetical protein IJ242_02660 [Clostridia bacterium]|nr:hypothetical protein [Clostridia bacterium]
MNKQTVLPLYIEALLPEQEAFLYNRARNRAEVTLRNMTADEAADYLMSDSFAGVFFHVKRTDKVYQGLLRGELILPQHQTEFDRLAPLIVSEKAHRHDISLPFLRSVQRSKVTLQKAHAALRLLDRHAPGRFFSEQSERLVRDLDTKAVQYLLRSDTLITASVNTDGQQIVPFLMNTEFSDGFTARHLDQALAPLSLNACLEHELFEAFPDLAECSALITPSEETAATLISEAIRPAAFRLSARLRRQFPSKRIQGLLRKNPAVQRLQAQQDALLAKEQRLRSALVKAVPEHYRDLYPLARRIHRRFILHLGPTNSGKTHESIQRLHSARRGIYLGPLRLLAAEQFETLNGSGIPCSLVTGEEQILVPGSKVQSSTVEMADLETHYDIAVIDECQMIADKNRGGAWTDVILGLCADEIHACASPDAEALLSQIITDCGDELTIVRHHRMTPLVMEKEGFQFPESVRTGDALIVFSKARVHAVAAELKRLGYRVSLIYGALPPDVRRDQAQRFLDGETDIVVSTDAIAMGMNLPIERIVFLNSEKYDGDITRPLTDAEIKQIAGRAGRYGQYETGYVNAFGFKGMIAQALNRPLYSLTEAVIRFPESLLGLPLPLTAIISQWLLMKDKSFFSKASTERMSSLASMLETNHTNKRLLYRFLCIPFDETEQDLMARWRAMYHAECRHEHVDVLAELPPIVVPEDCTIQMLDSLEASYRRCDLYYNYARLFLDDPSGILDEIQSRKSLISRGIIHILSTQKLQQRTCPSCRRILPWNWPYKLCDSCYRRHSGTGRIPDYIDLDDFDE